MRMCRGLLLSVEDDLAGGIAAFLLDEMAALHKHATGAASGVEDVPVVSSITFTINWTSD